MDDDPVVRRIEGAVGAPGVVDALAALPAADVTSLLLAVARRRYCVRTCFGLWSGEANLADGGFTDWCARLLGDRKERVLTSGIGLDRLVG
jgi:hypothetical protein